MPNSLIPLDASFVTSTHRLTPPSGWKPPKFSLTLAKQLASPYLFPYPPSCFLDFTLDNHVGFVWWHPWTNKAICQNHIDHIGKSWFYTNWTILRYQRVLSHLLPEDFQKKYPTIA